MKRAFLALGLFGLAATAFAACVGDSSTPGGQDGDEGYPCLSDGTCKKGLTCVSKVCVALDSGTTPDGSSTDSSPSQDGSPGTDSGASDSGGDSAPPTSCTNPAPQRTCQAVCNSQQGQNCCLSTGLCSSSCSDDFLGCQSQSDCAQSNGVCCMAGTWTVSLATCPATVTVDPNHTASACEPGSSCPVGQPRVCLNDGDCVNSMHCFTVQLPDNRFSGVCQ